MSLRLFRPRLSALMGVIVFLGGCGRSTPKGGGQAVPVPDLTTTIGDAIKDAQKKMEEQKVTIHVVDVPESKKNDVMNALTALLPKQNHSTGFGSGAEPYASITDFHAAPVSDLPTFAKSITFGRVLAVDSEKKAILVQYMQPPSSPADWAAGKSLSEQIEDLKRRDRINAAVREQSKITEDLAEEYGAKNIVLVDVRGETDSTYLETFHKLVKLRDREGKKALNWHYTPSYQLLRVSIAPVSDLDAFVKKIDWAKVEIVSQDPRYVGLSAIATEKTAPAKDVPPSK